MAASAVLCILIVAVASKEIERSDLPIVTPKFLDKLLAEKRYDEFNRYTGIPSSTLSRPREGGPMKRPMLNPDLFQGDIVRPSSKEEARQGILMEGSKWSHKVAGVTYIPVSVSEEYAKKDSDEIYNALGHWNNKIDCVKFVYYSDEEDYIHIFPGDGCWSYVGRIGGAQTLSLGEGCATLPITLHEINHAVGFDHEQSRSDRDEFVEVLWDNIPEKWRGAYEKNDPQYFGIQDKYDYYSLMHYSMEAPDTEKDAFKILKSGIDPDRLGKAPDLSRTDVRKIRLLYC